MDTPATSKPFVNHSVEHRYTIIHHRLYDLLLGSNLPIAGRLLVILVHRYSFGYHNRAVYIENSELVKLLPINRIRIPRFVKALIELQILKGGVAEQGKDGRIYRWELSVNYKYSEWNIGVPSASRKVLYELDTRAMKLSGKYIDYSKK